METIHVIKSDGEEVVMGMEALTALYEITGMGWLFKLAKLPVLSGAAEIAYKMVSKNRKSMGGAAEEDLATAPTRFEMAQNSKRDHPRAPLMEATRVDGVRRVAARARIGPPGSRRPSWSRCRRASSATCRRS